MLAGSMTSAILRRRGLTFAPIRASALCCDTYEVAVGLLVDP